MKLRQIVRSISLATTATLIATLVSPNSALAAGPTNTVLPTISGTLAVGQSVTAGSGSWDATPSSISYQWYRCSTALSTSCVQIAGATTISLKLIPADGGNFLQLQVTALSAGGGTTASSQISSRVVVQPIATVIPVITGVVQLGSTLTLTTGTWNDVITPIYNYKWQRCTSLEISSCADIPSATNPTYTVTISEIGMYIRGAVTVVATANNLTAVSFSDATSRLNAEPTLIAAPAISGLAIVDEILTATAGTYNAFPAATFTYQWQSCTAVELSTCTPISGASQATYALLAADIGKFIRVMVTATNNLGLRGTPSPLTNVVLGTSVPNTSTLPIISGVVMDRQVLTVTSSGWTGTPTGVLSYQWQRCSALNQAECVDLKGETKTSYTLNFNDVNNLIRVSVKSTNRVGVGTIVSGNTSKIMYATQLQTTPFAIGFAQAGQKWSATPGTWVGSEAPNFGYQWQNCISLEATSCSDIPGARQAEYTAQTTDIGKYLRVKNWIVAQSSDAFSDIVPVKISAAPKTLIQTPALNPKSAVKAKPAAKKITLTCVKGRLSKKVTGVAPKCPAGYKKK
jgi:hypothetical protein